MTNFSFEEQNTGITWIDGREIYQRSFRWNNPGNMPAGNYDTGNIVEEYLDIIDFTFMVKNTNFANSNYMPYQISGVSINNNKHIWVGWLTNANYFVPNSCIVTIWYCKIPNIEQI